MAYMVIHCESCGGDWQVYDRDVLNHWHARTCPHCGKSIDPQTWEGQVLPAFGMVADANRELVRDATGYHGPQFSFDVIGDTFFSRRPALDEADIALLQDVSDGLERIGRNDLIPCFVGLIDKRLEQPGALDLIYRLFDVSDDRKV